MADLEASDIADMLIACQSELGEKKITDLTSDLQKHTAANELMPDERVAIESGTSITLRALETSDNNSRMTGLFDVDNLNQEDGAMTGSVPWRHLVTGYPIDVRQLAMNMTPRKIVDLHDLKEYQCLAGQAAKLESEFWDEPASSTDNTSSFGVKYWLVYNATEGFNGGNNSNFSSGPGNIDRDTHARWKNWTAQYTNVTDADLIDKIRKAQWYCGFSPAVPNAKLQDFNTGSRWAMYTTYDTMAGCKTLARQQNDNMGAELDAYGRPTVGRVPIEAVPYLQQYEATADPLVGINWGVFKVVGLEGRWMKRSKPAVNGNSHNVVDTFIDSTFNIVCYDCRQNFLIAKSTWH